MHLTLLAFSGLQVGLIFGLAGMAFAAFFGFLGMYFHHRRQEQWHHTARLALEKGQPLPPTLQDESERQTPKPGSSDDLRSGLVLIAVGLGLYVFLGQLVGPSLAYVGAIPGFIGVALLIFGLGRRFLGKNDSNSSQGQSQS